MQQEIDLRLDSQNQKFKIFVNTSDIACYLFDQNLQNLRVLSSQFENNSNEIKLQKQKNRSIELKEQKMDKYRLAKKGGKDDTVQLNINFKTLLVFYFKQLQRANQLNDYQIAHIKQFKQRVPSFNSFSIFLNNSQINQGIKRKSLQFLSSKYCISNILKGRCKMRNKLLMIKFIERIRLNMLTEGKKYKWKDTIRKV